MPGSKKGGGVVRGKLVRRSHATLAEWVCLHRRQDGEWDGRIRLKHLPDQWVDRAKKDCPDDWHNACKPLF